MENILLASVISFIFGLSVGVLISFKLFDAIQNQLDEIEKDIEELCSKS